MSNIQFSLSGGGSKLPAIYGATKALLEEFNIKPRNISGISSGAIVGLFAAVGKMNIDKVVFEAKKKDIFKFSPILDNQKLNPFSLGRILRGKHSLGDQSNLKKLIKKNLSKSEFDAYVADHSRPNLHIGAVNYSTGDMRYFNIRQYDYDTAIDIVYASTCIPILTEGQEIDGDLYFDGGVIDHIGSSYLASTYGGDEVISVYSRPSDPEFKGFEEKGVFSILTRTLEIMSKNVTMDDEIITDKICAEKGIKNTKIFMDYSLMTDPYKFDKDLNKAMFLIGYKAAQGVMIENES